jgi:hypothetical protein
MRELAAGTGNDGPPPVAPASAPAPWLETELKASVVAAGGTATVNGGAGVSGAAAEGSLDTEVKASVVAAGGAATVNGGAGASDAAGAVAGGTAGWAGRLEMDVKPWAPAAAAVPS